MLIQVGKRDTAPDVIELLLECHERIRRFVSIARTIASTPNGEPEEIREAAAQVRRYFVESLPLHIADEHDDILPRLRGQSDALDHALARMDSEHALHEPVLARLVELCDELVRDPRQNTALSAELATVAAEVDAELTAHLDNEEKVIFPALRRLPSSEQAAVLAAIRERRARYLGTGAAQS